MALENFKKHMGILLPVVILILIEQAIKMIISEYFMNHKFYFIEGFLGFETKLNTKYSYINNLLDLSIGYIPHLILTVLVLALSILIYFYMFDNLHMGKIEKWSFIFVFAGIIAKLIDLIFWGGSLDYILLEGFFIFDLKDVYLTCLIIILIYCAVFNYKGFRKFNERKFFKNLSNYIRSKCF